LTIFGFQSTTTRTLVFDWKHKKAFSLIKTEKQNFCVQKEDIGLSGVFDSFLFFPPFLFD